MCRIWNYFSFWLPLPVWLGHCGRRALICASRAHTPAAVRRQSVSHSGEGKKRSMAERKRSIVWTYFTTVSSNEATCDLCRKCLRYCGNTTNLTKHLKVNHSKEHDDLQRRRLEEREREGVQGNAPHSCGPNEADLCHGSPVIFYLFYIQRYKIHFS